MRQIVTSYRSYLAPRSTCARGTRPTPRAVRRIYAGIGPAVGEPHEGACAVCLALAGAEPEADRTEH